MKKLYKIRSLSDKIDQLGIKDTYLYLKIWTKFAEDFYKQIKERMN